MTNFRLSPWDNNYDFFADKLKRDFLKKIIEYYFKLTAYYVESGSG